MSSKIIELSAADAVDSTSSAEWTNTISAPLIIPAGSQIALKNAFINTAKTDDQNIYLQNDINISLTFGYYDILTEDIGPNITLPDGWKYDYDYYIPYVLDAGISSTLVSVTFYDPHSKAGDSCDGDFEFTDTHGNKYLYGVGGFYVGPPGFPYATFDANHQFTGVVNVPNVMVWSFVSHIGESGTVVSPKWGSALQSGTYMLQGNFNMSIPAGEYTRANIAELITDKMQFSPPQLGKNSVLTPNSDFLRNTSYITNTIPFDDVQETGEFLDALTLIPAFASDDLLKAAGLEVNDTVDIYCTIVRDGVRLSITEFETTITDIIRDPITGIVNIEFNPPLDTQEDDDIEGGYIICLPPSNLLQFVKIGTDPTLKTSAYTYAESAFFGSSSNSLEYDENRQRFGFTTLYMPYINDNDQIYIEHQYLDSDDVNPSLDKKWITKTQQSGIFITSFNPPSFWEMLGFTNEQHAVSMPIDINHTIDRNELITKIPYAFTSLQSLFPNGNRIVSDKNIIVATTDTLGIYGGEITSFATFGYYLIEVGLPSPTSYFTHDSLIYNIVGIVSKYNTDGLYITGYGDSSLSIVNNGAPYTLNGSIRVRILDPMTKQPVKDLGNNSTIFLEIITPPQN